MTEPKTVCGACGEFVYPSCGGHSINCPACGYAMYSYKDARGSDEDDRLSILIQGAAAGLFMSILLTPFDPWASIVLGFVLLGYGGMREYTAPSTPPQEAADG